MKTVSKTLIALAAAAATLTAVAAPMAANANPVAVVRIDARDHNDWNRGGDWDRRGGYDRHHRDDRAVAQLNDRIENLQGRIYMGRRSGQLSFREARRLNGELDRISWQTRNAERSGRGLNGYEYSSLSARLDDLSAQVYGNRHDRNRW